MASSEGSLIVYPGSLRASHEGSLIASNSRATITSISRAEIVLSPLYAAITSNSRATNTSDEGRALIPRGPSSPSGEHGEMRGARTA